MPVRLLLLGAAAGGLADAAPLELLELPPHALTSSDTATNGMRNFIEARTWSSYLANDCDTGSAAA